MNEPDLSQLPYRHPPMTRGIDPKRMNWLWRLICELGSIDATEVMESLHAAGVPVDMKRVKSWVVSDRDASFFPMTLAEMERNMRTLVALRIARAEAAQGMERAAGSAEPLAAADAAPPAVEDGDSAPLEW